MAGQGGHPEFCGRYLQIVYLTGFKGDPLYFIITHFGEPAYNVTNIWCHYLCFTCIMFVELEMFDSLECVYKHVSLQEWRLQCYSI